MLGNIPKQSFTQVERPEPQPWHSPLSLVCTPANRSHLASFFSSLLMSWLKGCSCWARTRKSRAFWYSVMSRQACQRIVLKTHLVRKDSIFSLSFLGHSFSTPWPPTHLSTPEEGLSILPVDDQSLFSIAQGCGRSLQLQVRKGQVKENKKLGCCHQMLLFRGCWSSVEKQQGLWRWKTGSQEEAHNLTIESPKNQKKKY